MDISLKRKNNNIIIAENKKLKNTITNDGSPKNLTKMPIKPNMDIAASTNSGPFRVFSMV